mgnify:CR=1 FL=1
MRESHRSLPAAAAFEAARELSADRTVRWPDDQLCRRQGFRILGRPEGHPAVWGRNGEEFLHGEAVAIARAESGRANRAGATSGPV